jgi:TonB family protein
VEDPLDPNPSTKRRIGLARSGLALAGPAIAGALFTARPCAADDLDQDVPECVLRPAVHHYLHEVQDRILDGWSLPEDGLANREVVVQLQIEADGSLRKARIVSASDRRLARSVSFAVQQAAPFAPVPPGAECLVGLPIRTTFRNPAD